MIKLTKMKNESKLPVNRDILGHFIESGFGRQVSGMWSEMIFNRAFRKISPYTFPTWEWLGAEEPMYNDQAPYWHSGYEELDWEPVGSIEMKATHGVNTFKGKQSLLVENSGGLNGLKQRGIYVEKDRAYQFQIFGSVQGSLRTAGLEGFEGHHHDADHRYITVRFIRDTNETEYQKVIAFEPTQSKKEFLFTASFTGRVSLEIMFDWQGAILLSWVSMMPADNMSGWRNDVVRLMKQVQVPVVRFPGGCYVSFFNWENTIGPREYREPTESYYWGGLEENDVGLDEFINLSEMVGFKPQICFNMMSSTPFKARQLVEYLNAECNDGMGRLRELHGYHEPRGVKLFEMDNEPGRKWSPLQYAEECVAFGTEMRMADPTIELMMACYDCPVTAIRRMLDIAGSTVNYIIQRNGSPDFVRQNLEILREYNDDTDHNIKLVNTEWLPSCHTRYPFEDTSIPTDFSWGKERITNDYKHSFGFFQTTWFYALNGAVRLMNYMSYGGEFALANFNNCCNTWGQNIMNASKEKAWLSCAGEMFSLFGDYFIEGVPTNIETGVEGVSAQILETETEKSLFIVNNTNEPVEVEIDRSCYGELLYAPSQLSRITQENNPLNRKKVEATDSIKLPAWALCAMKCVEGTSDCVKSFHPHETHVNC